MVSTRSEPIALEKDYKIGATRRYDGSSLDVALSSEGIASGEQRRCLHLEKSHDLTLYVHGKFVALIDLAGGRRPM